MALTKYFWPVVGVAAVAVSIWLLFHELRGLSVEHLADSLAAIPLHRWLLCALATLVAYAALAAYDHVALLHLGRHVSWLFITVSSFTTYALSHNVGASVFSGAVVRYRAYSSRGLSGAEVGLLVAFCSLTFALGVVIVTGFVLIAEPSVTERFVDVMPVEASRSSGIFLITLVLLYAMGSWLHFRPLKLGSFELFYPRLPIVARQLAVAPLEIVAAAAIVYFALPESVETPFLVVLGIFVVSFSVALISHAPGGLGVLELVFLAGLPDVPPADVLAALLVFRLFYLIIPFVAALVVILLFERSQFARK